MCHTQVNKTISVVFLQAESNNNFANIRSEHFWQTTNGAMEILPQLSTANQYQHWGDRGRYAGQCYVNFC